MACVVYLCSLGVLKAVLSRGVEVMGREEKEERGGGKKMIVSCFPFMGYYFCLSRVAKTISTKIKDCS